MSDTRIDPYIELRTFCDMWRDALAMKLAAENRVRSCTIPAATFDNHIANLDEVENQIRKAMIRCYRRVASPAVRAWQQKVPGLGEHLMARLLGSLGDPVRATPHRYEGTGSDRVLVDLEPFDRNPYKLFAYCGVGDPTRRRRRGMTAEDAFAAGNPECKVVIHLLAEACVKQLGREGAVYRQVYDDTKAHYEKTRVADAIAAGEEPWSKLHVHNAALRRVKKAILLDLWRVSRGLEPRGARRPQEMPPDPVEEAA